MKAIIMAGGEGTRLRPLTSLRPKPMVPIVNQPVMEHILGLVKHHGITDVVATLAFMPQVIREYFRDGDEWGMNIAYAVEETPLGTAGSVKNAEKLLDDEPFLVISGDALTDIDLTEILSFHKSTDAAVTIALKRVEDPLDFGVVITDADGRVERFLEKPTWGQVFSDEINTGIYVIEPWVLAEIPEGQPYDFSSDLFPKLMEQGHPIFGLSVEGYWCDVGSRETYMQAHRDVLDGKAKIYIPGVQAREQLWVAESAVIDKDAELHDKVVIGKNTQVHAGAVVGPYSVIGDNCLIGPGANVLHSVVWNDTFIGEQARVEGAAALRHVDVRARAVVETGATIGDESVVGRGAYVGANVQVFPYKRIEPAATVNSSLIWETKVGGYLFADGGIEGLIGVDITPELALRVAEAFGSILPKGSHVVIARDTSRSARMVKRAMASGLNATGINVRDLRVASPALCRFTTQKSRVAGGIYIASSQADPQSVEIRFFDESGLDIGPEQQKKIERLYYRQEFRRAFFGDIGEILYPARPFEYYSAALEEAIADTGFSQGWRKIVTDMRYGAASLVLPQVAHSWHLNVIAMNPVIDTERASATLTVPAGETEDLLRAVDLFGADFGVTFDSGAERVRLTTSSGRILDGDTALLAVTSLWCCTRGDVDGDIAVPLHATSAVEKIAAQFGRAVVRPGRSRRSLARAVLDGRAAFAGAGSGGFIFGDFFPAFDGVFTVGMIARMIDQCGTSLDQVVAGLPEFHKVSESVRCPAERKGVVMREIAEKASGLDADLTEGVRIRYEDGWALVLPDATEPIVDVWAEGPSDEAARARAAEWRNAVEQAIATG